MRRRPRSRPRGLGHPAERPTPCPTSEPCHHAGLLGSLTVAGMGMPSVTCLIYFPQHLGPISAARWEGCGQHRTHTGFHLVLSSPWSDRLGCGSGSPGSLCPVRSRGRGPAHVPCTRGDSCFLVLPAQSHIIRDTPCGFSLPGALPTPPAGLGTTLCTDVHVPESLAPRPSLRVVAGGLGAQHSPLCCHLPCVASSLSQAPPNSKSPQAVVPNSPDYGGFLSPLLP